MSILTQIISGWPGLFYALVLWLLFHNTCIFNRNTLWPAFYYLFPRQRKSNYFKSFPIIQKEQVLNIPSGSRLSMLIPSSGILPEIKSNRSEFYALFSGSAKKLGLLFGIFVLISLAFKSNVQAATRTASVSGNWSSTATWGGDPVPVAGDDVVINGGVTVTIDMDVTALTSLAISGTLQYETSTARRVEVTGIVTINSGGVFKSAPSSSNSIITTHSLVVDGSIINNGTINFSATAGAGGTTANASGAGITFTGASTATFDFSSATSTNLRKTNGLVLNKGTNASSVLTFIPGGTFQVLSGNTDGFLSITNGTFKIIGTNSFSNPVFNVASYSIPTTGGFELSNTNATVIGQNGSVDNNGVLKISSGTINIGTSLGNSSVTNNNGTFELSGGEMNVAGRFLLSNATGTFSGGSLNISTIGHSSSTQASFECSITSNLAISGGAQIIIIQPNSSATPSNDIEIFAGGSKSITGGTFILGNATTPAGSVFKINSDIPLNNLTIGTNAVAILADDLTINMDLIVNGELQVNSKDLVIKRFLPDVSLDFTGGVFNSGSAINVVSTNGKHPQNKNLTNYLNHYWTINTSNITNPVVDVTLTYSETDVVGSDSKIITGVYKPDSKWYKYSPAATATNNLSGSGINNTSFSITGITSDPPTVTVTASPATICAGSSSNLTATPVGDSPFSYLWAPATGLSSSTIANPLATPAATTNYTVTVIDANGFSATASQTITVNALPIPTLTSSDSDNIFCVGTTVTFTASGGTNFNFRVNGISVQNGASSTFSTSTLTNGQTVDVIVTNASGCTATSTAIVNTVNALPTPTLSSSDSDNAFCAGTSVTFTAGGGTNYNFRVSGLSVQNGATSTYTTSALINGQAVDVIVTNASGCSATSTAIVNTVNALPIPTLSSSDSDNTFCSGTSVIFTAGGGTNYNFRVNGVSVQNGASSTYVTNTLTNGQTVDVIVTNALGCSVTSPVITNTVNPLPTPTILGSASPCANTTGNIYSTEAGMSGYNWSVSAGGTITAGAGTNSITVSWNIAGPQAVQVNYTNSNGCTSPTASVKNITVNALPNATITASGSTTFCQGGSVVLTASAGVGYLWNTGATTQSVTVSTGGNYSVTVTNASGCSATSAITAVTANPNPTVVITNPAAVCSPSTVNLSAAAITVGSTPGLTYTYWNDAGASSVLANYTTVGSSGTYYIKGTNSNGCYDIKPVVVTVNQTPTVTTANTATICTNTSTNITLSADVPSSSFAWTIGTITGTVNGASAGSASGATPKINQTLTSSGNGGTVQYIVTPTSPAGCVGNPYTITVTVQTPPSIYQQPEDPNLICDDGYATFMSYAYGLPQPTIQWQVSTNGTSWSNVIDGTGITGATTNVLSVYDPPNGRKYRAVFTNNTICGVKTSTSNVSTVNVSGNVKIFSPFKIDGCGDGTYTLFIELQGDQVAKDDADSWAEWYDGTTWHEIPNSHQTLHNGHPTYSLDIQYTDYPPSAYFRIIILTKKCSIIFETNPLPFGTASKITVANTCVGQQVQFSHNGFTGGTWTINDPTGAIVYTLVNAPGSTLNYTPTGMSGCYTATYATTNPGYCSDTKNFVVFPGSPPLTSVNVPNQCGQKLSISGVTSISGFTEEYAIQPPGGTLSAYRDVNATNAAFTNVPGCWTIKSRYKLLSDCGSTIAGAVSPCAESTFNAVVFPSALVLTAPFNACSASFTLPSIPAINGFVTEWQIDGGTYTASPTIPATPGCHTIRARYALGVACGSNLVGTVGAGCESNIVSVVIFPTAPAAPTVAGGGCGNVITVNPPTSVPAGFRVEYSFNDGASGSWSSSNTFTAPSDNCTGYKIKVRYVLDSDCGNTLAGSASLSPACAESPATIRKVDTTPPTITCNTTTLQTVCANTGSSYVHNGTSWDATVSDNCAVTSITAALTGATIATNLTTINGVSFNLGTTTITWTVTDGCNTATCSFDVTVNPTPFINPLSTAVCSGYLFSVQPVNGTNGIVPSGTTYTWSAPTIAGITGATSGTNQANISGTLTNTTLLPINVVYNVTPTSGSCPGPVFTVTVTVNPSPNCSIAGNNGPICPSVPGNVYTAPAGMSTYAWTITGNGAIIGAANQQNVTVDAGSNCNAPFDLTLTVTNSFGCTSTCTKSVVVQDIIPPVLANPPSKDFCVENISLATFNGLPEPNSDILEPRPDWYTLQASDLDLNPNAYFSDNCTSATRPITSLILHWSIIDDASGQPVKDVNGASLTNITGQVSSYLATVASIVLLGAKSADVTYTISYWLEDLCSNTSSVKTATITIKPRPDIVKLTTP